jgi:DNA repair protein RecO (recombination protein O)
MPSQPKRHHSVFCGDHGKIPVMSSRYRTRSGIVVRRKATPAGDVMLSLLTPEGKLRGVARAGAKNGLAAKVNLFHHLTVQVYQRPGNDIATLQEIVLEGALERLTQPHVYPYAHFLAELADKLYQEDDHVGQSGFELFSGGLRGLSRHEDPDRVALVIAWKILGLHGLFPRVSSCIDTDQIEGVQYFDPVRGGVTMNSGVRIGEDAVWELRRIARETVRGVLEESITPEARAGAWQALEHYLIAQVGVLHAWGALRLWRTGEGEKQKAEGAI